jgi:hypothetical protein
MKIVRAAVLGLALVLGSVGLTNYAMVQRHLGTVLEMDARNAGVRAFAHYGHFVDGGTVVFDLRGIGPENSMADVFRVLTQFSQALKDRRFGRVELAFRGTTKFVVDGAYFQQLGLEFEKQNPIYTIRTFPEKLVRPDGTRAFGQWSGGLIGVLSQQMKDFNAFHEQWYLDDLTASP